MTTLRLSLCSSLRHILCCGFILGSLLLTTGCGQTGPLYLPDDTAAADKAKT